MKRMAKANKLSSNFEPEIYKVMGRKGGDVTVASESGKEYRRHVSHLQKIGGVNPATAISGNSNNDNVADSTDGAAGSNDINIQPRVTRASKRQTHLKDFVI